MTDNPNTTNSISSQLIKVSKSTIHKAYNKVYNESNKDKIKANRKAYYDYRCPVKEDAIA